MLISFMNFPFRRIPACRLPMPREGVEDEPRRRLTGRDLPRQPLVGDMAAGRLGERTGLVVHLWVLYFLRFDCGHGVLGTHPGSFLATPPQRGGVKPPAALA